MPASTTNAAEVFRAFLRQGLSAFGGPIAHVGFFRREFVEQRRWLDDAQFAQLLAIAQFLPGPASSQLGFGIGLLRAGWRGAIAAFAAFTLPSALLLFALASAGAALQGPVGTALTRGLKLTAVAVVAHGVIQMARRMTPDAARVLIALAVVAVSLATGSALAQIGTILFGAVVGAAVLRDDSPAPLAPLPLRITRPAAASALVLFTAGLSAALLATAQGDATTASLGTLAAAFWRAGSLVFGGGHVVLPLLEEYLVGPGWITRETFLSGYGAAQAIPGPMFSLAAYLGALVPTGFPAALGASVATLAVFAPGFLLMIAVLPAWSRVTAMSSARHAVAGINAAVVGLLAAALIDPVILTAIHGLPDIGIAAVALALLWTGERSALWCVAWCVAASLGVSLTGLR